jgi:hypothetical protein
LSKIVSLFVARLSVFISIRRGFEENGSRQEKKQMAGTLVLDPLMGMFDVGRTSGKVVMTDVDRWREGRGKQSSQHLTCLVERVANLD